MSPTTRPFDTECEAAPSYPINATDRSSITSSVDNSVNKSLPFIWFNGVLAALALGLAIGSVVVTSVITQRSTVSENHWRNIESEQDVMRKQLDELQESNHVRR